MLMFIIRHSISFYLITSLAYAAPSEPPNTTLFDPKNLLYLLVICIALGAIGQNIRPLSNFMQKISHRYLIYSAFFGVLAGILTAAGTDFFGKFFPSFADQALSTLPSVFSIIIPALDLPIDIDWLIESYRVY